MTCACEVLLEASARCKTFCPTLPPGGGISDACERCPVALKKERGRELQLLILCVLRIYTHKFLEIMGVLLNMFYLDEYISFLTIVCGSFCGSLEYIVCLGTACENMATVLKEISCP